MAQITAGMVRELREKTGAGMMDCKKALVENESMEAAIKFLREKGLTVAAKKAGRVASEGLVAVCVEDGRLGMVEVNCETDFVARNADFQKLTAVLAKQVAFKSSTDLEAGVVIEGAQLMSQAFCEDNAKKVEDVVNASTATIGEKIAIRRAVLLSGGTVYGSYIHGGGSIGSVVELTSPEMPADKKSIVQALAKDLAMHVAAAAPLALDKAGVDEKLVENEREVFRSQALEQKKPEKIIDRIISGKVEKYFAEVCLLEQKFIKDPDISVAKLVEKTAVEVGAQIKLTNYARFKVGEGLEKKTDDLASEVAKMVS